MNSQSLRIRYEIDSLCDVFEDRWNGHSIELIRETAATANHEIRDDLLKELIVIDRDLSQNANQSVDRWVYVKAFPQLDLSLDDLPDRAAMHETQAISDSVADRVTSFPTPDRIGDYTIEDKIGSGGMGVVYRATDTKLNRTVAIKMMAYPVEEMVPRFQSEAAIIASLDHFGIVQIFESGVHLGRPYLVLEYVGGGTLDDRIKAAPLPSREAAKMALQIAKAIQVAHSVGVIHRDLKPANVLLADDGRPKLADFGLAREQNGERQTLSGKLLGTPGYMAPEQTTESTPTTAVDVYGLGGILYACLTGQPPFKGKTVPETLRMVCEREPISPRSQDSQINRDLNSICLKCLQKRPEDRYVSIAEATADLRAFIEHRPVKARPTQPFERIVRWCRRNPAIALLASVLLIAVTAGAAGVLTQWRRANTEVVATRSVVGFLKEVFEINSGGGRDGTVRQSLYAAVDRIDEAFDGRPDLELTVRQTLGDSLRTAEDYEESAKQYRRALSLSQQVHGETARPTLEIMDRLAGSLRKSDIVEDLPEAAALRAIVVKERQRQLGKADPDTLQAMNNLATVYLNLQDFAKAEAIYEQALRNAEGRDDVVSADLQPIRFNLVFVLIDRKEFAEAEAELRQILKEMDDADISDDDIDRLKVINELAGVLHDLKRDQEALALYQVVLPARQFKLGPDSGQTLSTHRRMIRLLLKMQKYEEAWGLLDLCLKMHNFKYGRAAGLTFGVRESAMKALLGLERTDEAIQLATETVAILTEDRGPDHRYTQEARAMLSKLSASQ